MRPTMTRIGRPPSRLQTIVRSGATQNQLRAHLRGARDGTAYLRDDGRRLGGAVRFDRLREERLARIGGLLAESSLGALLCFDMANIRYITATHIGTWAQDKLNRFCLLPQHDEPIMWDFGSAARHHQLYNPWLGDGRSRAGISTLRGAMSPESGRAEDVADKIRVELEQRGLLGEPVGVDAVELPVLFALQERGIQVVDGQQLMQQARVIKTGGRDHAAEPGVRDGRRRIRGAVPHDASPGCARTSASAWSTRCSTTWDRSSSRASTRSLASAAIPTRTSTPTGRYARATRRTSTSCTATWAIARATTARSRWRARRRRSSTPTSAAATTSTPRSR